MNTEIKILIVEDSLTQAEKLKYILEKNKYQATVAHNGIEALEIIEHTIPDLIITDITMPEMNGYELCQKIKEDVRFKSIPIIILTSLSDPCDVIEGLKAKADNFITKPYNEKLLLARIHQMLINFEMRKHQFSELGIEVYFAGEKRFINSERIQIIDLLLSTFENAVQKTQELEESNRELKKALEFIKKLERNYRVVIENSPNALIVVGYDEVVRYVNPAAKELFGDQLDEILTDLLDFTDTDKTIKELSIPAKDGSQKIIEIRLAETTWEGEDACILSAQDVTEKAKLQEKLKIQSLTDELTGLYNRRGFIHLAEHNLKLAKYNKHQAVLFFIDLDKLKSVNDTLGHTHGDAILTGAANVLKKTFRDSDIIARIGGDEFLVLSIATGNVAINHLTTRLEENINLYNSSMTSTHNLSMSVGALSIDLDHPCSLEKWIEKADHLMYENKKKKYILSRE